MNSMARQITVLQPVTQQRLMLTNADDCCSVRSANAFHLSACSRTRFR